MPPLAARLDRTELAATFAMAARARALRAAGQDVISLSIGEPDFPTPPHIIAAAHQAALRGETKYPPLAGTEALKTAIRAKFLRDQKLDVSPETILVTNGGKQAIFNVIMAVIDAGDEVLIPAPAWSGYEQTVNFAGGLRPPTRSAGRRHHPPHPPADPELPQQPLRCGHRCRRPARAGRYPAPPPKYLDPLRRYLRTPALR
jgi:aspartate/methionine/tyrosine aminotransferase